MINLINNIIIRCVQLIEPALSETQTQYIERLLAIYLDEEPSKSNQSIDDGKIYTLEDYTPKTVSSSVETADVEGSIWKQTPGKYEIIIVDHSKINSERGDLI